MTVISVGGGDTTKFTGGKCLGHAGELWTGDDDRSSPNGGALCVGLVQDVLTAGQRIGSLCFTPDVFAGCNRLAIEMLVLLHIGRVDQEVEIDAGQHLVDVWIVIGDVMFFRP